MTKGEGMEFLKEHKKDIFYIAVSGVVGAVVYRAGVKHVYKNHTVVCDSNINNILRNANYMYGTKNVIYSKTTAIGFKPDELGKLGEAMSKNAINNKVELPDVFTHFIAIGPGINK